MRVYFIRTNFYIKKDQEKNRFDLDLWCLYSIRKLPKTCKKKIGLARNDTLNGLQYYNTRIFITHCMFCSYMKKIYILGAIHYKFK